MSRTVGSEFSVRRFVGLDGRPRGTLINRSSMRASIAASLYGASLARRHDSHNTLYAYLGALRPLFVWAQSVGLDIDRRLLSGDVLTNREIRTYSMWLSDRLKKDSAFLPVSKIKSYNASLLAAERMFNWFVTQYMTCDQNGLSRNFIIDSVLRTHNRSWNSERKRYVGDDTAPDITDDDISKIETFLRSGSRASNPEPRWVRGYLIWRLAIEFGFRIGEILALRTEDCPNRERNAFRIVRIEERRVDKQDPRGRSAPRPKTMPRELAPVITNTAFPMLVNDYIVSHRFTRHRNPSGHISKRPIFGHPYLLVNCSGLPLPTRSATNLAEVISRETGIKFSWHLARHAFFNRAYEAVARIEDATLREIRTADLVHWGGWRNPTSLDIYVRRVRQERARSVIRYWSGAAGSWEALG